MNTFMINILLHIAGGFFMSLAIGIFVLFAIHVETKSKEERRKLFKYPIFVTMIGLSLTMTFTILGYIIPEMERLYGG